MGVDIYSVSSNSWSRHEMFMSRFGGDVFLVVIFCYMAAHRVLLHSTAAVRSLFVSTSFAPFYIRNRRKGDINSIVLAQRCPVPFFSLPHPQNTHPLVSLCLSLSLERLLATSAHHRINTVVHSRIGRRCRRADVTRCDWSCL